jgi:hypothetical protein
MGSIPTTHMLATCDWAHPVQRYSDKQQRDYTMSERQKETLYLFIEQIIANKSLSTEEKTTRIIMAIDMIEGGAL